MEYMIILKIFWVTTELTPYAKAGGLADVSTSLPKAISHLGYDIRILLPFYGFIDKKKFNITSTSISFKDYNGKNIEVFETKLLQSQVPIYLIKHEIFSGNSIYDENNDLTVNMAERFALFSWISVEILKHIEWTPDIIHANDWPSGPVMSYVDSLRGEKKSPKSIFTIHNLAYQGSMVPQYLINSGLNQKYIRPLIDPGDPDTIRYLRMGINHADQVSTVSRTYAREILTPEFGYGVEKDLMAHPNGITGIVHGIDVDEWDPEEDSLIQYNYNIATLEGKELNKTKLQVMAGISIDLDRFTIGVVSRLVYQKGINLLVDIIPQLMWHDIQLIILGTGDPNLEDQLKVLQKRYPRKLGLFLKYNNELSHKIFAGVDGFIVPSRYEPCGLTQLYAMEYGTVPIVRRTGGLSDTVSDKKDEQTGFLFDPFDAEQLRQTIMIAYETFKYERIRWKAIQQNGMKKDLSWDNQATKWIDVYRNLMEN